MIELGLMNIQVHILVIQHWFQPSIAKEHVNQVHGPILCSSEKKKESCLFRMIGWVILVSQDDDSNFPNLGIPSFCKSCLWTVAWQPLFQCLFKQFSTLEPIRNNNTRCPEIKAMCRISQNHTKQLILSGAYSAFGNVLGDFYLWCKIQVRSRWIQAPRVELPIGPVSIRWSNGPSTKDFVGFFSVRQLWEERSGCVRELEMAYVALMLNRVVFWNELMRANIGGLEESCT